MLTDCYLPRLGGIEVQVADLSARLVARGHEVEVFTLTPGGVAYGHVEILNGIPVHRLGVRLPRQLLVNPLATRGLRDELKSFDVAHIHMGVVSPFASDCGFLTTRMGLPTTMTWHCVLDKAESAVRAAGVVRRWAQSGMAMNAVSDIAATPLRRIVDGPPVLVLPNGIDVESWRPTAGRPLLGDGIVRFVSAMRLEARKRPVQLVELMAKVRAAAPRAGVRLEILGEGSERPKIERAIARLGAQDWIALPGRVPRDTLKERYAASDVFVSPSVLESFGIAALEARVAGLPIVGRVGSGISEFVTDDVNGFLADDDEELVRRLTTLAVHPSVRSRMTAYNLKNEPTQSWDNVVQTAESEYARALALAG